ncbi:MAG: GGDEF domain-containing protein [Treponema sp.]
MLEVKQRWFEVLQKTSIFSHLTAEQMAAVLSSLFYCEVEEGQTLVYDGEIGSELFIIVEGSVSISVKSGDENIELGRLRSGDFFGEMSLLEQTARSATCTALENTACFMLKARDFSQIIVNYPDIAVSILQQMLASTVSRLLKTNSFLTQVIQWGNDAKKRAITDPFTGLFNRRYLDDNIENLIRSHTETTGISFAMVDIDHFGTLNKKYGSVFCDNILLAITEVFKAKFEHQDTLIRYGGDEFCFIISGDFERAKNNCRSVCEAVHALRFAEYPDLAVSCSIGLVPCAHNDTAQEILKRSDEVLYSAKEQGRNRVCTP